MITEIEIGNVRLFEGGGWKFPLAPLTLFCGANSAGKSSIIKTLLLMQQSQNQRMGVARPLFRGDAVDLWNYQTFVSNGETNRDISIGITIKLSTLWSNLVKAFKLEIPQNQTPDDLATYYLKTKFIFKSNPIYPDKDEEIDKYGYLHHSEYEIVINDKICFSWAIEYDKKLQDDPQLAVYWLIIPKKYIQIVKSQLPRELGKEIKVSEDNQNARIQLALDGFLPFVCIFSDTDPSGDSNKINIFPIQIISQIFNPANEFEGALNSFAHIAPLRPGPRRYYSRSGDLRKLDSDGEFVPVLLHENGQNTISYIRPNKIEFKEDTLLNALNDWLYYLRTGDICEDVTCIPSELSVEGTKGFVIEINLRTPSGKSMYPMADSGVGLSQVLPILSRTLVENEDSTLLIEQPELHLHPALQVRLAEFFVCMSRMGKQIIVETHSEHIVNTVRVLAAEDETGEIAKNSQIHFIDIEDGKPKVHNLSIQPNGIVPNWPNSFFGEAMNLTGRLLRAQKRFRQQ